MRNICKVLALLMSLSLGFSMFTGCGNGNNETGGGEAGSGNADYFTAPATVKVLKDRECELPKLKTLKVSMGKNEYESGQIVLLPKGDIVYDLKVSNLKTDGGQVFPSTSIEVFNQHYIQTISRSNSNSKLGPGWYPEALIPIEKAREKGELKASGKESINQGLWVKFHTKVDTAPGLYKGHFILTVNNKETLVPVEVKVWNYTISDESHSRTAFLTYQDSIIQGEGDNSDEMMEQYYKFFLDNRITVSSLPAKPQDNERLIEMLRKYYNHPHMTGYAIPYVQTLINGTQHPDYEKMKVTIKMIVDASLEDKVNYLEKAYFYITLIDEFDQSQFGSYRAQLARDMGPRIDKMLVEIRDSYTSKNPDFFKDSDGTTFLKDLEFSLINLPDMAVAQPSRHQDLVPYYEIWTIPAIYINNKINRDFYNDLLLGKGREHCEMWWYTCVGPINPHVSYHIDDYLLSARAMGWMQKDYNITGNLYWSTAAYVNRVDGDNERPVDPYTNPKRFGLGTVNGDGYLVYPGAQYGVYGPIGSVRTEAIRDSGEDYEVLWLLEQEYKKMSEYYGMDLDLNNSLRSVYDSIYTGDQAFTNADVFQTARETVAGLIEDTQNAGKLVIEGIEPTTENIKVSVLLDGDATVEVNGKKVSGEVQGKGKRYIFDAEYSDEDIYIDFDYTLNGNKHSVHKFISTGINHLMKFTEENKDVFGVTEGSDAVKYLKELDGVKDVYQFGLCSKFTGNTSVDSEFEPAILLRTDAFNKDIVNRIRKIQFRLYNPLTTKQRVTLKLYRYSMDIVDYTLKPGWNTIKLDNIQDFGDVSGIIISFKNKKVGENPYKYNVYMADFVYQIS